MWKFLKQINLLNLVVVPFILGFLAWALWGLRTRACVDKSWLPVSLIVFVEEFLSIFTIYLVINNKSKISMFSFAIGGATGAAVGTIIGVV